MRMQRKLESHPKTEYLQKDNHYYHIPVTEVINPRGQTQFSSLVLTGLSLHWGINELSAFLKPVSNLHVWIFGGRFHFHISILFSAISTHKSVVSGL